MDPAGANEHGKLPLTGRLKNLLGAGLYILMTVCTGALIYPRQALLGINEVTGGRYIDIQGLVPILNPSSVGVFAAIVAIFSAVPLLMRYKNDTQYRNKFALWILLTLLIGLLLLSRSRTQMIAFAVSFICILFFSRRYVFASFLVGAGAMAVIISEVVIKYFLRYLKCALNQWLY